MAKVCCVLHLKAAAQCDIDNALYMIWFCYSDVVLESDSVLESIILGLGLESVFLWLGLGCKELRLGLERWGLGLELRLRQTYDAITCYFLYWDGMFKNIQWLYRGCTCHKLILKSLTVLATSAPCKLNTYVMFSSGGTFIWPQRTGLLNKLNSDLVSFKCIMNML